MIQALALARPVVTSESPEKARFLDDGVSAVYVPPGDVTALARAIDDLRQDPARRRAIGTAGRRAAIRHFSEDRLAEVLRSVGSGDTPATPGHGRS